MADRSTSWLEKLSLCWRCENACGRCSWSEVDPDTKKIRYQPVPGWVAVPTMVTMGRPSSPVQSYQVLTCPEFDPTPERVVKEEDE